MTVVLRETSVLSLLELLRMRATIMIINTAAPTTHTHGWVYHSVVVVVDSVVVTVVLEPVLSWAHEKTPIILNKKTKANLTMLFILTVFITVVLIGDEILHYVLKESGQI